MKTMKDYAPKPSDAIRAMIDGLRASKTWDRFHVDMGSYGKNIGVTCYGCAATCAIQQATGIMFHWNGIAQPSLRASKVNVTLDDLSEFEIAIDAFRRGAVEWIFRYYEILPEDTPRLYGSESWALHGNDWEDELPLVEKYLEKVIAAGL